MLKLLNATKTLLLMPISMTREMKQAVLAIGTSLLLFGCSSEQTPSGKPTDRSDPTENTTEKVEPISTSIDEIFDTYAKNQIAGAKKFEDKTIRLTGKAVRVREAMGTGFLMLRSKKTGREQEFAFSDSGTALLAEVSPGDTVTVTCPGVVEGMGMIFIAACSDLKVD